MSFSSLRATANWADKDDESILWVASYPRSGNTFTRLLLANYFLAEESDYQINKLSDFVPSDTSKLLWKYFSSSSPQSPETVWAERPKVFEHFRRTGKARAFFGLKTHTANVTLSGLPGFDFRPNDRAIYIVRHPLDVLLSYSDYNDRDIDSAIDVMCTSGVVVSAARHGAFDVRGSWAEHVTSWLFSPSCPILLVRYEELCQQTEQTLRNMLSFLGSPAQSNRVKHAVDATRFDRVQEQEATHSFIERPSTTASGTFFRKGMPLQWLRELSPHHAYRLADRCGDVMRRLGYTDPRNVFFDGRNALGPVDLSNA